MVIGKSTETGFLTDADVAATTQAGLRSMPLDGRRVFVVIPDGTRTMPMPTMFEHPRTRAGPRVAALDYLVALGTHTPMTDAQLTAHVGRLVVDGVAGGAADLQSSLGRPVGVRARSARFRRARSPRSPAGS